MLLTGPDLLCNLLRVITRFRVRKHSITAEIEGMNMQDFVNPDVKMIEDLRRVLQQGSFNLTKWITTDHRILQTIPEEHRSITVDEIKDPKIFK